MSFRENPAGISMLSMVAIYGFYFWSAPDAGPQSGGFPFGGLPETIVALVIVQTVLTIVLAI